MRLILAAEQGFCPGVERALRLAREARARGRPVYTEGPLVHNARVVRRLEQQGIRALPPGAPPPRGAVVVLRAHGVPPRRRRELEDRCQVVDATCPRVRRVQELVERHVREGYEVLIVGDPGHPEVEALLEVGAPRARLWEGAVPPGGPLCLVSQTTQDARAFEEAARRVREACPGARIVNTICPSAARRQAEAQRLARRAELVVVVGGNNSANTRRLAEIVRSLGTPAILVEDPAELPSLEGVEAVGLISGASTPIQDVEEVRRRLEAIR